MVVEPDIQQLQRLAQTAGGPDVLPGGQSQTGGMTVGEIGLTGSALDDLFHDPPLIHQDDVHRPLTDPVAGQQLALGVGGEEIQRLHLQPYKAVAQYFGCLLCGSHRGARLDLVSMEAAQNGGKQLEQSGGVVADAHDLLQLLGSGLQYGVERAEPIHQLMGQGIHVPLGMGIEQDHLQQLVVMKSVAAVFQKLLLGSFPVPAVDILGLGRAQRIISLHTGPDRPPSWHASRRRYRLCRQWGCCGGRQ